ncbi:MAG: alpha/beta fold hydrolase [Cypionkella sp.]|nr:alpha/beta fold hydrolase [Cypionkella sp.]
MQGQFRIIPALLLALSLAACAPRGAVITMPEAAVTGSVRPVFIGTTRGVGPDGEFDGSRVDTLHFTRLDISVPPIRETGEIKWTGRNRTPDPKRDFLTTQRIGFDGPDTFRSDLSRILRETGGEAVIFVHGFNNTFAEGAYRIAQLAHDLDLPGAVVHYSWPSAAQPLNYVYDRDSAIFARDGLEQLLTEVENAGAQRVILVAHSMGSALTMETLRQIAIRDESRVLRKVSGVVLISPDIDVDVFRAQAKAIPRLPQPFIVFSSERDRILQLSARLAGRTERLGAIRDLSRVADLPITFLDTAAFNAGTGHFNLGNSPALIRLMERLTSVDDALDADRAARTGLLPGVVLTVQNATQIILRPVAEIGSPR